MPVAFWSVIWPHLVGGLVFGGVAGGGWWLRRTDRFIRGSDRQWRRDEAVKAGQRTLAEVEAMTGTEFEDFVVDLCRRDGCCASLPSLGAVNGLGQADRRHRDRWKETYES
ncbi:hypothetical protein ACFU51_32975 [Streptomyces sp. NPDC057430]|uniref:hypothetical protein n=1 Tax=Streptomyces sp. NPDC057430 TaxID=3346131 RepID=UPI0036B1E7AB